MDEFILVITLDNSYLSQQKWDAGFYRVLGQLWKPGDQLPRKYSRAKLPEAPELLNVYQAWLKDYKDYYKAKKKLNNGFALYQDCDEDFDMEDEDVIQVSIKDLEQKLKDSSDRLKSKVTDWFKYPDFLELELQIRADLPDKQQPIQVIFETEDEQVKRLPLDNWQFFHNYPQAQLSLSLLTYNRIYPVISNRKKIRFLLILGNSTEIDVPEFKRQLDKIQSKEQQAEIILLPQPSKKEFFDTLYNEEGWDIVIFAGHGKTENKQGIININEEKENNTITMLELKNSLEKAISKGLKLAIFNSCDGLGLGKDLAALNIPEIILFKEPVPQEVAKEFFRNFLDAFILKKTSLYLAVHEATKKLQALENEGYLCATMLPVLYHNPSQEPLSLKNFKKETFSIFLSQKNQWNSGKEIKRGKYTIEKPLGQGRFGLTYLAKDKNNHRFAVKTLNPQSKSKNNSQEKFWQEAIKLAKCHHPHIVSVKEPFEEEGIVCIPMEYIEGIDLEHRANPILPEEEALKYIQQVGDALAHIHQPKLNLVHRDVKPANIMLRGGKSEAVLIDFGLARDFDHILSITEPREQVEEGYSPLEVYSQTAQRGAYTDVYSLAATLYTLLTGKKPCASLFRSDKSYQNYQDPLTPPKKINPKISDDVNDAIMKGMKLRPEDRPQSIYEWFKLLNVKPLQEPSINNSNWVKFIVISLFVVVTILGVLLVNKEYRCNYFKLCPNSPSDSR